MPIAESSAVPRALSVSQLVDRIKSAVRVSVGTQWVEGEISNLRIQSSGHAYFTLKDAGAQIACVFFKQRAAGCKVSLKEGIQVRVFGEATMYEQRGQVQLVLSRIEPLGEGDLQAKFLALKAKLEEEGLFAVERKKKISGFPRAIGIITSPTGAAIQDMRNVLEERAPWVKVYLLPVLVQGDGAAAQISSAIRAWSDLESGKLPKIDTLIIARGGGSIEDLWCFNEEIVARAIADCPIPIISGVGHETDFTIADFAADLRAPTPTAAAMLATPDKQELLRRIDAREQSLIVRAKQVVNHAKLQLSFYERSDLKRPLELLERFFQQLDEFENDLFVNASSVIDQNAGKLNELALTLKTRHPRMMNRQRLQTLKGLESRLAHSVIRRVSPIPQQLAFLEHKLHECAARRLDESTALVSLIESRLETRNPLKTLERGFAIVRNKKGKLVTSPAETASGELIDITVKDGHISARTE